MRHTCALTALLVSSTSCYAQTSVDLYGIVDAGLRSTSALSASNAPTPSGTNFAVNSGIDNTSRWGIKGQESLGDGWKARIRLEGGINVAAGMTASRANDRHGTGLTLGLLQKF